MRRGSFIRVILSAALVLGLFAVGCGDDDDEGENAAGHNALVNVVAEAAGANCEFGGQAIQTGVDANDNNTLDASEVAGTSYLCNGAAGAAGAEGAAGATGTNGTSGSLVAISDEIVGDNCSFGGQRVDTGVDDNDNGTLDTAEIDDTSYVCHSTESLVDVVDEPAGDECPFGGILVSAGLDDDGDGTLDVDERDESTFVCTECADCPLPFVVVDQSDETDTCVACHAATTPSIIAQWQTSAHYGEQVGCFECHEAEEGDPDDMVHNGQIIAVIVSPDDCGECHEAVTDEFTGSHHAEAGQILDSLDNRLAEVIEGYPTFNGQSPVAVQGCAYCHGSDVQVNDDGTLTPETYPNSGIGRINPDGSWGACSACHTRHDFSQAQARAPDNCGRCHLGPDHPQMEVYTESQHGIVYAANIDEMALDSDTWVVGEDYTAAPTCATCHMGATPDQDGTHDVAGRLSWNLRAPVSFPTGREDTDLTAERRDAMQNVCETCHSAPHVENFYAQLDAGVELYNSKYGVPARDLYNMVRNDPDGDDGPMISTPTFDDEIEWAYFYLWHHEGRRARTGMAMIGPDYVQWHGFYDLAERFYFELLPMAQEILAHNAGHANEVPLEDLINEIMASPDHQWFTCEAGAGDDWCTLDEFNAECPSTACNFCNFDDNDDGTDETDHCEAI